jgi:hypothetical protein
MMPKIVEFRIADEPNYVWAKIPLKGANGAVTLYTEEELKRWKQDYKKAVMEAVQELFDSYVI